MKCLKCDHDRFVEQKVRFGPEIKGQIVEIILPCMICENCKTPLIDTQQMNVIRRAAADKYREQNKLLTSEQIIAYRETLGMSQTSFARYLKVGEASIKRWETYYIQDASQDDHIRLKCDEAYAEMNFLEVHWKHHDADIYSGNRKFNLQIFKQVVLFLVRATKETIIYLNKLHYYADFLHFFRHNTSMTGVRYVPLRYGPCPDQYRAIYDSLVKGGLLKEKPDHSYEVLIEPDLEQLDDEEIKTLKDLCKIYQSIGAKKIYDLAHQEKGYKETPERTTFISYEYAKDLLILKS